MYIYQNKSDVINSDILTSLSIYVILLNSNLLSVSGGMASILSKSGHCSQGQSQVTYTYMCARVERCNESRQIEALKMKTTLNEFQDFFTFLLTASLRITLAQP